MTNHYFTIEKPSVTEYKDRGSKFIAHTYPLSSVEEFKKILRELKDAHPKAAHYCFAYRLGTDGNNFRSSDDGEPAGTAGKPILGQLDSKKLTNLAVIVIRYFGGTLLGVPGLIQAYKTSSSLALQLTPIVQRPIMDRLTLDFDYTMMNEVMTIVKKFRCEIYKSDTQLFCTLEIGVPRDSVENATAAFAELRGATVRTANG